MSFSLYTELAVQGCDLKSTCYRYKAEPSEWQSYFNESPIDDEQCDYYWETAEERAKNIMRLKDGYKESK
jgi:hypothetical protein